jgi:protein-glutamine gamma-glutamyltransferase
VARTLVACLLPAAAIALAWLRVEEPIAAAPVALAVALALAPALVPRGVIRWVALGVSSAALVWLAFGAGAWEILPFRDERFLGPLATDVTNGVDAYYAVLLPFDPRRQPEMEGVLLLAVFGFVAAVALLVAARRPLPAAGVAIVGAAWPATLLGEGAVLVGALALGAALSISVVLRARSVSMLAAGTALAALVVAGAAWTSSATTFSREGVLDWETWDFGQDSALATGVQFVWDANYEGISFPRTETPVLRIRGPEDAQYWRASTLDAFFDHRWYEQFESSSLRPANGSLVLDTLTPAAAKSKRAQLEQRVEVKALADDHLVAAGTPVAVDARSVGSVFFYPGGVVRAPAPLRVGTRYRVRSYAPSPSPAELAAAPPRYPLAAAPYLEVWGRALPPYGSARRDRLVREMLADPSYLENFGAYRPLYRQAKRVTAGAESPYAAVLALESWFRRRGGFRYEERPPRARNLPPLVHFVAVTKAGYCQHYAGAMAVMLRLLGVPARVAVGFTSGDRTDDAWVVTDRNAHAWVEAWFPGHGWIAFDPTPGRGTFSAIYSFASNNSAAIDALARGRLETLSGVKNRPPKAGGELAALPGTPEEPPSVVLIAVLAASVLAAALGLVKWLVRRVRYLTIQPRLIAAATRKELEAFLRDQGVPVTASATLDDLRGAVAETLGLEASRFVESAGRGRFGPPRDTRPAAQAARQELQLLLRRARGQLSFWARLRGFLSLRSLRSWQG